jgi:hypothetical protein
MTAAVRSISSVEQCAYCQRRLYPAGSWEADCVPGRTRTVDHIESEASPRRERTALVYACQQCNTIKAATPAEVFRHWLGNGQESVVAKLNSGSRRYRQFCHELLLLGLECLQDREDAAHNAGIASKIADRLVDKLMERA